MKGKLSSQDRRGHLVIDLREFRGAVVELEKALCRGKDSWRVAVTDDNFTVIR